MKSLEEKSKTFLGERFEFKYILDNVTAIKIERFLKKIGLVNDVYSKDTPYLVNSLYFDTPTLSDYRDKDGSHLFRKKIRARTYEKKWYSNDGVKNVWLEIKKKRNMNIKKSRIHITNGVWRNIIKDNIINDVKFDNLSNQNNFEEFKFLYKRGLYSPHVIIKYKRMAYMYDFLSPVRITFDSDIRACFVGDFLCEENMMSVAGNRVIMEVKYTGKLPWWFNYLITQFNISRDDFSKYRNSVAMLRGHKLIPISK